MICFLNNGVPDLNLPLNISLATLSTLSFVLQIVTPFPAAKPSALINIMYSATKTDAINGAPKNLTITAVMVRFFGAPFIASVLVALYIMLIKADGLAAGKGVTICKTKDNVLRVANEIFKGKFKSGTPLFKKHIK